MRGTFLACLRRYSFAERLSPRIEIESGEGPIQIKPAEMTD